MKAPLCPPGVLLLGILQHKDHPHSAVASKQQVEQAPPEPEAEELALLQGQVLVHCSGETGKGSVFRGFGAAAQTGNLKKPLFLFIQLNIDIKPENYID